MNERLSRAFTRYEHHHPQALHYFLTGFATFSLASYIFTSVPPSGGFVPIFFILLMSVTFFCILSLIFTNTRRIALSSAALGVLLLLRAYGFFDSTTAILLIIFVISLELALKNR